MTSKTLSHTPGPWFITERDSDSFRIGSDTCGIAFLHDPMMRELGYAEELEANARLIAAAPDLLVALSSVYSIERGLNGLPDSIHERAALYASALAEISDICRAAIAKATGER